MDRDYSREFSIDNWPPGFVGPLYPPDGYVADLERIDEERHEAFVELRDWHHRQDERRRLAWVEYHDEHGWPDDPDYQERMRRVAVHESTED